MISFISAEQKCTSPIHQFQFLEHSSLLARMKSCFLSRIVQNRFAWLRLANRHFGHVRCSTIASSLSRFCLVFKNISNQCAVQYTAQKIFLCFCSNVIARMKLCISDRPMILSLFNILFLWQRKKKLDEVRILFTDFARINF